MNKIIILFFVFITQISCAQEQENRGFKVKVGDLPPTLDFTLLDGTKITNENLRGKVVVLQFTASWCSVCIKEMPHLEKDVWQQFKNDDFILIGVDLKEDLEKVKRFIKKTGVTYPFTIDKDGSLFESFTLPKSGVTRNIVLNKKGEIIMLTRLYEEKEFAKMVDVIAAELKN